MSGTYQTINPILQTPQIQRVKQQEKDSLQQESNLFVDQKEGPERNWTQEQNFKYTLFINHYQSIFASKHKRKVCKIFQLISQYMQPRSPTQCRSHFQKLINKHKSITKLKRYYKNIIGQSVYRKKLNQFRKEWESKHQPLEKLYPEIKETKQFAVQTMPQEQQPSLCTSCKNERKKAPNTPHEGQLLSQMTFWSDLGRFQAMFQGNYMFWVPNSNEFRPRE